MSLFSNLIRKSPVNALSQMTYNTAGALNLPVEIWEEIFNIIYALIVAPSALENELQTSLPPNFTSFCESSSLISDFYELQTNTLFDTRRSIILVCKAWYYMAISTLQSHIYFNFDGPIGKLESLAQALKRSKSFASRVVRFSIKGAKFYPSGSRGTAWLKADRALQIVASILPHLRIITCPYNLARAIHSCFHPEVAIVYQDPQNHIRSPQDFASDSSHFWHRCHTLSFSFPGEPWFSSALNQQLTSSSTFHNLIHLKLEVIEFSMNEWIISKWTLPSVRTLSITSPRPARWVGFIERLRRQLEGLEVLLPDGFHNMVYRSLHEPPLPMPKLKTLCLSLPISRTGVDEAFVWVNHMTAPSLTRFTFHVVRLAPVPGYAFRFGERITMIPQVYPTVKILGVHFHEGINFSGDEMHEWDSILKMSDVITWCDSGLTVEVAKRGEREKRVFPAKKKVGQTNGV